MGVGRLNPIWKFIGEGVSLKGLSSQVPAPMLPHPHYTPDLALSLSYIHIFGPLEDAFHGEEVWRWSACD